MSVWTPKYPLKSHLQKRCSLLPPPWPPQICLSLRPWSSPCSVNQKKSDKHLGSSQVRKSSKDVGRHVIIGPTGECGKPNVIHFPQVITIFGIQTIPSHGRFMAGFPARLVQRTFGGRRDRVHFRGHVPGLQRNTIESRVLYTWWINIYNCIICIYIYNIYIYTIIYTQLSTCMWYVLQCRNPAFENFQVQIARLHSALKWEAWVNGTKLDVFLVQPG